MSRRPAINLRSPVWGLLGVAVALAVYQLGVVTGKRQRAPSLTDEVVEILRGGYYRPVNARQLQRMQRQSVDGVIATLNEPFTRYLDPSELVADKDDIDGAYTGVGVTLGGSRAEPVIEKVLADSPAARGGVLVGDRLLAVNGRLIGQIKSIADVIKGPAGTKVVLRLQGATAPTPRDVTLTRGRITVDPVESEMIREGGVPVGQIRLLEFDRGAGSQVDRAARDLIGDGARSIVLDLRGDRGGLVQEAIRSASVFLPKGTTIATTDGAHQAPKTLTATGGAIAAQVPLVVLVDANSASASEILAGALRDNDRATLVGTRTFGKALIQVTRTLSNGGGLRYVIASYLTPDGLDIGRRGLLPSIAAADNPATPADEALDAALEVARGARPGPVRAATAVTG